MIGEIEQALSAEGLSGDTYLVFSSDDGRHSALGQAGPLCGDVDARGLDCDGLRL